jgi:hypothetical protein
MIAVRQAPSRAKRASASLAEAFGKGGKPDARRTGSARLYDILDRMARYL